MVCGHFAQLSSGGQLGPGEYFLFQFYRAFVADGRWEMYLRGVLTTLELTVIALAIGLVLGVLVAVVRTAHDQQRPGHRNFALGVVNLVCKVYTTVIRGTPMIVQMLIMAPLSLPPAATSPWWAPWPWASTPGPMWRRLSAAA